ncbi:MAG: hypothetical protein LBR69_08035 [Endomicrobium sp.]|jgi:hypothetical protein|nr:hypothetical protein [Endomicrobium sp.]
MEFFNEQMLFSGKDTVEIPCANKRAVELVRFIAVFLAAALFVPVIIILPAFPIKDLAEHRKGLLLIFAAVGAVYIFLTKLIILSLYGKNKFIFEFNNEGFIAGGKAIKWADMQAISYGEYSLRRRNDSYYITIYYEQIAKEKITKDVLTKPETGKSDVKDKFFAEITKGIILKMNSEKAAKLIADKFYQYYGTSQGLMLKKQLPVISFLKGFDYKIEQISGKGVLQKDTVQSEGSSIQIPNMFR